VSTVDGADAPEVGAARAPTVTVYWRPGCPYCASLRRGLQRAGLATAEVDIWSDPAAASFVRSHADGNETVPTVDVAGTVVVNPSTRRVLALAADAGVASPTPRGRWWRRRA
jgi:glutaredoxin-like protein